MDLSVTDIDKLSDRIEELMALIEDFGHLALKLPLFAERDDSIVSTGEYRVRDVLGVTGGKGKAATVVRNGPQAHRVFGGINSTLANAVRDRRSASE